MGVSIMGLFIPLVDFIKLRFKSRSVNSNSNLMYSVGVKILISLSLLSFCKHYRYICNLYILFYIILLRSLIGYAVLGIIRVLVIMLRFEIRLFLMLISLNYINYSRNIDITVIILPITRMLCVLIFIIEINRHPFEIIEGESELVSGFNIELSSLVFMMFFLSEIINITVMTIILCLILNNIILYRIIILLVLIIRTSYPRIRYDFIVIFQWTTIYIVIISLIY